MTFRLLYGTAHCTGRITYEAGTAETREEALAWSRTDTGASDRTTRIPESDPLRWCPVQHCHMKRQRPWRSFREILPAGPEAA